MEESSVIKTGLTNRSIIAAFWSSSGTVVQFVSNVAVIVILARLLTPVEFGLASAALLAVSLFQTVNETAVGYVIVQRPSLGEEQIRTGFTLALLLSSILTIVLVLLAPLVAQFFHSDEITPILRITSLMLLVRGSGLVAESLLRRDLNFKPLATVQIISFTLGYSLVSILLALSGSGAWALVGAQLAQIIIESSLLILIKPHSKNLTLSKQFLRDLANFGGGATASKFIHHFAVQGDNFVVGRGLGTEALGLYGRAYRLMALPANILGDAIDIVLFSTMAKLQNDPERLAVVYQRTIALTALVIMPISSLCIVLAPEIIQVALGPQWIGAIVPLRFLSISIFFRAGYKTTGSLIYSKGKVYQFTLMQVWYALLIVVGSVIGQYYGLAGVSLAVTVGLAIYYFTLLHIGKRITHLSWKAMFSTHLAPLALTFACLALSVFMAGLLRATDQPSFIVASATSAFALVCMVLLAFLLPNLFLGNEGLWWVRTLAQYSPFKSRLVKQA